MIMSITLNKTTVLTSFSQNLKHIYARPSLVVRPGSWTLQRCTPLEQRSTSKSGVSKTFHSNCSTSHNYSISVKCQRSCIELFGVIRCLKQNRYSLLYILGIKVSVYTLYIGVLKNITSGRIFNFPNRTIFNWLNVKHFLLHLTLSLCCVMFICTYVLYIHVTNVE